MDAQGRLLGPATFGDRSANVSFTIDNFTRADNVLLGGYTCQATIFAEDAMMTSYNFSLTRSILFSSKIGIRILYFY